jgi:hypothetical protein
MTKIIFELRKSPDLNYPENNKELIKEVNDLIHTLDDNIDMIYINTGNINSDEMCTRWITSNFKFPKNVMYIEPISSLTYRISEQNQPQRLVKSQ